MSKEIWKETQKQRQVLIMLLVQVLLVVALVMQILLLQQIKQIAVHGNSATASKLATARNIKIQGAVSGNANFDGSNNVVINVVQANIAVLTGNITTPAAGNSVTTGTVEINYPARI